jgi:hypothetical protein
MLNLLIILKMRSSTRRVRATTIESTSLSKSTSGQQSTRDMRIVKHIVFILGTFIVAWTPVYVLSVADLHRLIASWISLLLECLPVISSLINVLDLYLYNNDLRQYLKQRYMSCLPCRHH